MSAGTVTLTASVTVTLNVRVTVLGCESVAVHVTAVVPIGKVSPEVTATVDELMTAVQATGRGPSIMSVADGTGINVTGAPLRLFDDTVTSLGTVSVGGASR